jgi:uncharacterized Zn finger protein (UPF0148 family)
MTLKILSCKGCGMSQFARDTKTGEPACPICGSREFGMVELPEALTCDTCHTERSLNAIIRSHGSPPFYKHGSGTYYCGCRGWD